MKEPLMKECLVCDGPVIQDVKNHMSRKRFEKVRFCSHKCWVIYDKQHPSGFRKTFVKNALYAPPSDEDKDDIRIEKIIEEVRSVESRLKQVDTWIQSDEISKYLGISK